MIIGDYYINGYCGYSINAYWWLLVLKKRFIEDFLIFNLWHHTLNQYIHIDTMYPFGITHFNTMTLIPLCENYM
jgi:hypothetical protein